MTADAGTVLAHKGSLAPRRKLARPCALRAVPASMEIATGGSGGMS
jgi:hypothetical protein